MASMEVVYRLGGQATGVVQVIAYGDFYDLTLTQVVNGQPAGGSVVIRVHPAEESFVRDLLLEVSGLLGMIVAQKAAKSFPVVPIPSSDLVRLLTTDF